MAKFKLKVTSGFMKDFDNAYKYISITFSNEQAALNLMKEIDDSLVKLKDYPEMYSLCDKPLDSFGYRKMTVKNYIIIYSVDKENGIIYLLRLFYGRQDYLAFRN